MGDERVYASGDFLPARAAHCASTDLGLLYGDGVYETLRLAGGRPADFDAHLDRLGVALRFLGIPANLSTLELYAATAELARRNGHAEGGARIVVTRGPAGHPGYPHDAGPPAVYIHTRAGRGWEEALYETGASLVTASIRQNADSPVPRHKTLSCLERVLAGREARAAQAHEALLLNTRGEVAEGARSSVFCVLGGEVLTPPLSANILPGVTRAQVLEACREAGIPCAERPLWPADLDAAGEVFVTGSLKGVLPVTRLDGRPVGAGVPGALTRRVQEAWRAGRMVG